MTDGVLGLVGVVVGSGITLFGGWLNSKRARADAKAARRADRRQFAAELQRQILIDIQDTHSRWMSAASVRATNDLIAVMTNGEPGEITIEASDEIHVLSRDLYNLSSRLANVTVRDAVRATQAYDAETLMMTVDPSRPSSKEWIMTRMVELMRLGTISAQLVTEELRSYDLMRDDPDE